MNDSNVWQASGRDFIRQIIDHDLTAGKHGGKVVTRFPPEPNGFLHIGHAKSIVLNFGIAREYPGARCHLRFDDTNPTTEDMNYVLAIQEDVRWLGYDWGEHLFFASDYFEAMYGFAVVLIEKGLAYVDSQSDEAIREGRGTVTVPGRESPFRSRSVEENLRLFQEMKEGKYQNGEHVLRAKIDMGDPNMLMRDPILYRIRHAGHFRTGDRWCIYPLYDYAHPLEDALEGITHSLCTLEFANNRELYDWTIEHTGVPHTPRQYEFARLNLDFTVMSKRRLLKLVEEGDVEGWDDPRMLTIAGLRRRGFTPEAIRGFCEMVGVARSDARVDVGKLEYAIRDDLNRKAPRVLAVLDPIKVVLTNWPAGEVREIDAPYFPHDVPLEGSRKLPFSGELYIDRPDFEEIPPPGFHRLTPGGEVRLRYGCVIRCDEVVKGPGGEVVELRCSYDPGTWAGEAPTGGRKVKGTIQWVSALHALPCEVRLYDRLFTVSDPEGEASAMGEEASFRDFLNRESLRVVKGAFVEPSVAHDASDTRYQFERLGYFWRDPHDGAKDRLVFNRIVTLRDSWARASERESTSALPPEEKRTSKKDAQKGRKKGEVAAEGSERKGDVGSLEKGEAPSRSARSTTSPDPESASRQKELIAHFGIGEIDAEILSRDAAVVEFYRAAVLSFPASSDSATGHHPQILARWLINQLPPVQGERPIADLPFGPPEFASLVALVERGIISHRGGNEALAVLAREGGDPEEIVGRLSLAQVGDTDLLATHITEILAANPDKVVAYRGGKTNLIGFFMGQLMRRTEGKADPEVAKALVEQALG